MIYIRHLMSFFWIFLFITCNKKSHNDINNSAEKPFQFTEMGKKEILEIKFPDYWNTQNSTKNDDYFEEKLNDLDYFDKIKGRLVKTRIYNSLLAKKNQKIDSLFILDSISNKDMTFVYVKSYKTENGNYEFPPPFQEIDLLIFSKSNFKEKVNIYSYRNYPYSVGMRLGYLNNQGNLYIKEFEADEEKTAFVKEEHFQISKNGNVKLVSSVKQPRIKNLEEVKNNPKSLIVWKGDYEITTKAISDYNNEKFDMSYYINISNSNSAILSIGAKHSEDYLCEGDYKLQEKDNVLHARGKCDQDDRDDFYLKFEGGKYFIKSKRFINQDWQELKKE